MASFANQTSNLSALAASIDSLTRYLDAAGTGHFVNEDHEENARSFLSHQHQRLYKVEEDLLKSTEHILPSNSECWTLTELSGLCKSLHTANIERMRRLHELLKGGGDRLATNSQETEIGSLSPNWSLFIGKPLEPLDETDRETDGTSTPIMFSMLSSPPLSSSTQKVASSETPRTNYESPAPAAITDMKHVYGQSSSPISQPTTATIPDLVERWRLQRLSRGNEEDENEEEEDDVGDETFEYSVATGPTVIAQSRRLLELSIHAEERESRSSHDASFSSSEKHMHDKNTEETYHFLQGTGVTTTGLERNLLQNRYPSEETKMIYFSETTVSNKSEQLGDGQLERANGQVKSFMYSTDATKTPNWVYEGDISTNLMPNGLFSDVLVSNSSPLSAAATELTMDDDIQNATLGSPPLDGLGSKWENQGFREPNEAETPVLDRYRLEPDDNSIGVKVVPNARRRLRQSTTFLSPEATAPKQFQPIQEKRLQADSNTHLTRKTFQKTPHPKSKRGSILDDVDEENKSPNFKPKNYELKSREERVPLQNLEPSQVKTPEFKAESLQSKDDRLESLSRTPLTNAWIAKHMSPAEISKLMDSIELPEGQIYSQKQDDLFLAIPARKSFEPRIQAITVDEYNNAARVVQMQVSAEEVNESINVLNSWLHSVDKLHFTDDEACAELQQRFSLRKSKSLLMSLCHWRRVIVRINNGRKEFHIRSESTSGCDISE